MSFLDEAIEHVFSYVKEELNKLPGSVEQFTKEDVRVLWFSQFQNDWKAILETTLFGDVYYEVNYFSRTDEMYLSVFNMVNCKLLSNLSENTKKADLVYYDKNNTRHVIGEATVSEDRDGLKVHSKIFYEDNPASKIVQDLIRPKEVKRFSIVDQEQRPKPKTFTEYFWNKRENKETLKDSYEKILSPEESSDES